MSALTHSVIETLNEICKRILYSMLGESACLAILFFLRKGLSRDPFEVFWDDPKAFYSELKKVLGAGADLLIKLLVSRINSDFGLNMNPERFLELMHNGDQSSIEEIRAFLIRIVESYASKGVSTR